MQSFPSTLMPTVVLVELLAKAAQHAARVTARQLKQTLPRQGHRGETLTPGSATPLWNQLIKTAQPLLQRRGEKVKLARLLGLPRQRIHDFFVARNSLPDGERMLLITHWLDSLISARSARGCPSE